MKRLSRLTAVLLALVLTLSMSAGAWAETLEMDSYNEAAYVALHEFIMNTQSYSEYWEVAKLIDEAEFDKFYYEYLTLDERIAMSERMEAMYWDSLESYENAAPISSEEDTPAVAAYSLRSADYGISTIDETDSDTTENGLILNKTATSNNDGTYKVTLEAYVTGIVTTTTTTTTTPCDIVLVLDFSNSMSQSFDGNGSGGRPEEGSSSDSKIVALQTAVNNFIDAVNAEYTSEANHKIALVTYNGSATTRNNWTEVSDANVDTLKITDNERSSWQGQGTMTDEGLSAANTLLGSSDSTAGRQKVVILFTDGVPGNSQGNFDESTAVSAITNAKAIKENSGAVVYSIAVLSGADPTASIDTTATTDTTKINAMLHAISSNYLNASASSSGDTLNVTLGSINPLADKNNSGTIDSETEDASYYLTADSASSLNNIFQDISSTIQSGSASMQLDSTTVVKDIVSPYFTMPANTTDVTVQTFDCKSYTESTGAATWSGTGTTLTNAVKLDADNNAIEVTGFDFQRNYVAEKGRVEGNDTQSGDFYGRKLVITFTVSPTENFLGGNGVITNGSDSAVYKQDGTLVEAFTVPTVDVPVETITPSAADQNIYLTNAADLTLLRGELDSRIDGTNNDYVTVKYEIIDGETVIATCEVDPGATAGTWTTAEDQNSLPTLDADKIYSVQCTVTPSNSGTYSATDASDTATVYVYKPVYEFKDTEIDYLADAPTQDQYNTNNKVLGPVWKHDNTVAVPANMQGAEPELTLTYTPASGITDGKVTATDVVPVNVTVIRPGTVSTDAGTDITDYTTFLHSNCDCVEGCTWTAASGEFLLHVINVVADLTITKTGLDIYAYDGGSSEDQESAIFTVTATDKNGTVQTYVISLYNNQSVTIKDLRVNTTYTITEQNDWTWRYATEPAVNGEITEGGSSVTIHNDNPHGYWLGGDNYKVNVFGTN